MPEGEFFLAEECSKPEEADDIAELPLHHPRDSERDGGAAMNQRGYCIFIHTFCQGRVPSVHESKAEDPPGTPESICVFATKREAQLEIADFMMTRLKEFMDGDRDFEDAIEAEEYVVAVTVQRDGTIIDEDGRRFGSQVE